MRVIGTKLLSVCRKPLVSSRWGPWSVSQLCLENVTSLGKLSALDCSKESSFLVGNLKTVDFVADKVDLPLSSLHSSNIFLKPQVVLYDGVCHLCNAGVNWVIKTDKGKRISFCAVQSEVAEPYLLLCGLTRQDVLNRFLFVEGPGHFSQASTAALRVALYLPFPYPLLGALLVIPAPLRDAIYDFVASRRYKWFGRAKSCILPKDDVLDHFIDRNEIIAKYRRKKEF
ncbi:hypothetical protein L7F22_050006 [Adiantum nelumboides]|nr:hypothetical protein [Adiantum nelumboides]